MITLFGTIILLAVGLGTIALKRSLRQMLFGIIIMELAIELLLVLLGDKTGLTLILVVAVAILLTALVAAFKTDEVNELKELKG